MFDRKTCETIVMTEIEALVLRRRNEAKKNRNGTAKGDQRCGQGEELRKEFGVYVSLQLIATNRTTPGTRRYAMKRAERRERARIFSMLLENHLFPAAHAEPA
jgi:hypothetical protein